MTISKKLLLIATIVTTSIPLIGHTAYDKIKIYATAVSYLTLGPTIAAASISKLQLAKQLKNIAPDLKEQIKTLQKRGRTGLAIGAILSIPHVLFIKDAVDTDYQEQQQQDNPSA